MSLAESQAVKMRLKRNIGLNRILGGSEPIKKLRKQIERIASCDVSVLISGECGTGKELAARAIHYLSRRKMNPFVPVNCGAIPENLFENELFGHRKGAFTDATSNQEGLVKEARQGTLFLDEIGVITAYIQVKLLRLLQDKEFKPLGDARPQKADIRIVAATNKELRGLVKDGTFREDLFFRLNIVALTIPPLRERKKDIPLLVDHFLKKYSVQYSLPLKPLSKNTMVELEEYSWPGNVRELENKVQHAIVMATGPELTCADFQLNGVSHNRDFSTSSSTITGLQEFKEAKQKAIEDFEQNYLVSLMEIFRGDVVEAAQKAGKSRTALWNLLSKYRIHPKQFL